MDNKAYTKYIDTLSTEGFDSSITYVPNDVSFGWINDPVAVQATLETFPIKNFTDTPAYGYADEELPDHCYLWDFAKIVTGDNLPPRNQGQVGSCVAFGCCSAIEYTMCVEITQGQAEEFKPLVQEIVYGGSRVEIGKGQLGRGDGSIGAWGADFVRKYGILNRGTFLNGKYNLEKYSESLCRQWGAAGVPNDLEPLVKEHPVKYTTQISDWNSAKKSLVQGYGISVASNQGFTTSRDANGVCKPSGSWAHQMAIIGYATINKEEHGFILNSWGTYMGNSNIGPGEPSSAGFYAHWSVIDKMLKQDDSFCYSAVEGFPLRKLRWKI
jgi:hypothetical protein